MTLTATDEFGQMSSDHIDLTVTNVAPVVTLTLAPASVPSGGSTTATVTSIDPGNDPATCTIDWSDGAVDHACTAN